VIKPQSNKTTPTIELCGLQKSYRRGSTTTPVLQGVDLTASPGECAFLAGPSGSGKTTLLSILGCILSGDEGSVRILGEDLDRLGPKQLARLRLEQIGFVFQRFHLIRGLTAVENAYVPLTLLGVPQREAHGKAMQLLEAFGVADKATVHPANLSTGQCQRIALARALANDPQLILADEPTASLDAENGQSVMQLLRSLASDQQKTVVVVTHDTRIFDYADRIHWLENGQIVRSQSSHDSTPAEHLGNVPRRVVPQIMPTMDLSSIPSNVNLNP